jgi:hypothetical protein
MATHCLHIARNNYPGTGLDLAGCVADARNDERLYNADKRRRGTRRDAIDRSPFFGECDSQIVLLDEKATVAAAGTALRLLMQRVKARDWAIVTASCHGTYVRDSDGDETDGYDEALYLDRPWVDDQIATIIESRPEPNSRVLLFTDACHTGTGNRTLGGRMLGATDAATRYRFMRPNQMPAAHRRAARGRIKRSSKLYNVIHVGACRDNQFAADAVFGGRPEGALHHFLFEALDSLTPGATFGDWFEQLAKLLPSRDYEQEPVVNSYARCLDWKIPVMK